MAASLANVVMVGMAATLQDCEVAASNANNLESCEALYSLPDLIHAWCAEARLRSVYAEHHKRLHRNLNRCQKAFLNARLVGVVHA